MVKKLFTFFLFAALLLGFSVSITWAYVLVNGTAAQPIQGGIAAPGAVTTRATGNPIASPRPCIARPECLDAHPRCMIAEPAGGWCTTTPTPTPIHCGGFIRNAPTCPSGYSCRLGRIRDAGGTCIPNVTGVPSQTPPGIPVAIAAGGKPTTALGIFLNNFTGFFTHLFSFWK